MEDSEFKRTLDHDTIRQWIEEHSGTPINTADTNSDEIIDIGFGPTIGDSQKITWDEFFERFDTNKLAFRYTDDVVRGQEKQSYSFISSDSPSDSHDDETEFPESNELAEENINNEFSGE